jgi:hypothetical protein
VTSAIQTAAPQAERFPLTLAIAAIIATGLGLAASALAIQWGASTPTPDALESSWQYVNIALVWTFILVWPAISLNRARLGKATLLLELAVLLVAATPAMGIAAFLTQVTIHMILFSAALQIAFALFAAGAMAWRRTIGPGVIAGILAAVAVALPIAGYIWAEFFPAASQSWRTFIPTVAASRAADSQFSPLFWWVLGTYALIGFALWTTAPTEPVA